LITQASAAVLTLSFTLLNDSRSKSRSAPSEEADHKQDQENNETNLRDSRSRASDSAKTKNCGDDCHNQEHPGIPEHICYLLHLLESKSAANSIAL
jgi:hypothetical protein